jgi:hypothetical protein
VTEEDFSKLKNDETGNPYHLLSAFCCLLSAVCCLLACCLLSAACCLLSAACCLLCALTDLSTLLGRVVFVLNLSFDCKDDELKVCVLYVCVCMRMCLCVCVCT